MNLVVADVIQADSGLALQIGSEQVAITPASLAARPALSSFAGKTVVLGLRSEDMEDASLPSAAGMPSRLHAKVTLTEALGSEVIVHFTFVGQTYVSEDTKLLQKEVGAEELHTLEDAGVKWVASFGPRSRVRMGDTVEIALDLDRAHYFDPETSEAIRT